MEKILVTGAAGFIGFHLTNRLLDEGWEVVGVDNLNDYYDPQLKLDRLAELKKNKSYSNFRFLKEDIANRDAIAKLFETEKFDYVVNLAAQAGVRYSIENPQAYIDSNIQGFLNILEGCRNNPVKHLVYASSSSVYGGNTKVPFEESDRTDTPISLYAATKKSNELMAHTYSHLYDIPATGLRFFTVYGPWGRPDMAYYKFAKKIENGDPIDVYNHGDMERDFTYIDDIIEGIIESTKDIPERGDSLAVERVFNIGNHNPEKLGYFIDILEEVLGTKAKKNYLPMQAGDVYRTFAEIKSLNSAVNFEPRTNLKEGLEKFADWFKKREGSI